MTNQYTDPEGRKWLVLAAAREENHSQLADLLCIEEPGLRRRDIRLPDDWESYSAPELWFHLAPEPPVDRLGRIARSTSPHIHSEHWFEELKKRVWHGGFPPFIDGKGTSDNITALMHAVLNGDLDMTTSLLTEWGADPTKPSGHPDSLRPYPPETPFAAAVEADRPDMLLPMVKSEKLKMKHLQILHAKYTKAHTVGRLERSLVEAVERALARIPRM